MRAIFHNNPPQNLDALDLFLRVIFSPIRRCEYMIKAYPAEFVNREIKIPFLSNKKAVRDCCRTAG